MDLIVPESDYFEIKNEWVRAFEVLKQGVKDHPNESKYLCKLAFFCWYHSSESDGDRENLNEELLDSILIECFVEGRKKFSEDVHFLVVFGEMMSLTPYLFTDEDQDYCVIEKLGQDYIEKAFILAPDNPFIKLLFIDTRDVAVESRRNRLSNYFRKLLKIETIQEKEYNELKEEVANNIVKFGFSGLMLEFFKGMNPVK